MFETATEIGFAVALLLPGFLVGQLSERRRPSRPAGGDLELVLRGLVYALIIQACGAFSTWLPSLVHKVRHTGTDAHLTALALYGLVVCVLVPTVSGLLLGTWLRKAESDGALKWWHYALGGRDTRRAWDYAFSQHNGSWIRVVLKETDGHVGSILGKFGKTSWASQSPADPDLYLQEAWPADDDGQITEEQLRTTGPAVWLSADQTARIELLDVSDPFDGGSPDANGDTLNP